MRCFRFVARHSESFVTSNGDEYYLSGIGGSNRDQAEAQREAVRDFHERCRLTEQRSQSLRSDVGRMIDHHASADHPSQPSYGYGTRLLAEEWIREITDDQLHQVAVITRNRYGALVLNTPRVAFIDIDFSENLVAEQKSSGWNWLGLKGEPATQSTPTRTPDLPTIISRCSEFPTDSFRIYQTRGGYRLVLLNRLLDSNTTEMERMFGALGADPLYVQLCRHQECFRARLTPKPWQIDCPQPPSSLFPRSPTADTYFQEWLLQYDRASQHWGICLWRQDVGPGDIHPEVAFVLSVHDAFTLQDPSWNLA